MAFFSVDKTFYGSFRINDEDFETELSNTTTTEFQTLQDKLQPELQAHFCDEFLSCEVTITRFSAGSIVCNFEINVQTTMNRSTLEAHLQTKLSGLAITDFDITPVTISTQGN